MRHLIAIVFLTGIFAAQADVLCPVCQGKVLDVTTQEDDESKPSRNIGVWNRSMCVNDRFQKGSLICPKDGYAYESERKDWELSLINRDGFAYPLDKRIYSFPLPTKATAIPIYSQKFVTLQSVEHSLFFWYVSDAEYFHLIRVYAKSHGLSLEIEKDRDGERFLVNVSDRF